MLLPDDLYEASKPYLVEVPVVPVDVIEKAADEAAKAAIISLKKHARGRLRYNELKTQFAAIMGRIAGIY